MAELIVLDLETTGLDPKSDSIIEIAAVLLNNGKVIDKFQTFIKPLKSNKISATVSTLTNIKSEDLIDAPKLSEVHNNLLKFLGDRPIIGHNIGFDLDFLKANKINFTGEGLDTLELAYTILPKLKFYSLEYLAYIYKFPNQPSHRAMNDVLATADLYNMLIAKINNTKPQLLDKIKLLINKSNWEWDFVFKDTHSSTLKYTDIYSGLDNIEKLDPHILKSIDLQEIKTGFNVYELAPLIPQISNNILLAQNSQKSVLVVNANTLRKFDWDNLGFNIYNPTNLILDENRFSFFINKDKFSATEIKLAIKILLQIDSHKSFDANKVYLSTDEFYLFDQQLSIIKPDVPILDKKIVTDFSGFWELLEIDNILTDYNIFIPQWTDFDDFTIRKQTKIITMAYFNAVVASRRDFVHDFIIDNKQKDRLFKILNELGSHLVLVSELFNLIWQEQKPEWGTTELEERHLDSQSGVTLKDNITKVITILTDYENNIKNIKTDYQDVFDRQVLHTQELINNLNLLMQPNLAHKIYLESKGKVVLLRIIKDEPINIWQSKLKQYKIIIISNGVLVDNKNDFMSFILGSLIETSNIQLDDTKIKDMIWIKDLPDNKNANYQREINIYLNSWLKQESGKSIVVMPNVKVVSEFFDEYKPKITNIELLNRDIAGNVEILKEKLKTLDNYAILVSNYNLSRLSSAISNVDRIIFVKFPFEPPNLISQLIYTQQLDNGFMGYSLPKAIVNFKNTLSGIYDKTNEIWMLDSKLLVKDYGKIVRKSIKGFREIEEDKN